MENNTIAIRDQREKEWYWMNNEFVDDFGEILGVHVVAVYSVLCRHSNNETQKCFPSMETIGRKAGIKSRKTVSAAIQTLEDYGIIEVEKASAADGKRLNNIYHLKKPSAWKRIGTPIVTVERKQIIEVSGTGGAQGKFIGVLPNGSPIPFPEGMDMDAWHEWEQYRKDKKQKLTPLTIKKQLKFIEANMKDHVEIINRSIMNGWTGLFVLPVNYKRTSRVAAPSGKYASISK
jgi:biotin operon repressor